MLTNCLLVAVGGGLGAVGRYLLGLVEHPLSFPLMTLAVNFLGAVIIGAVACATDHTALSPSSALFLKTGFCGGFTTFSTFSLETVGLLESGRLAAGLCYAAGSVVACLAGFVLGRALANLILPA